MLSGVIVKRIFVVATVLTALVLMAPSAVAETNVSAESSPAELQAYVKKMDAVIKTEPQAKYYGAKGQALEWLRDYSGALEAFSKNIELAPDNPIARFRRGENYRHLERNHDAIKDYDWLILHGSKKAFIFSSRGLCRYLTGDLKGGLEDAKSAIALDPKDDMAWFCKGSAEFDLGFRKEGLSSLSEAIMLKPNVVENRVVRGKMFSKLGKNKDAERDFNIAKRLGWNGSN